ncbi:MAG TPA: hypothetical protein VIK55_00055 [Paludibacter sp.]
MKVSKKLQLLSLLLVTITFNACANPKKGNSQASAENSANQQTQVKQTVKATSPLQAELNQAKAAGKAVFVVVTGTGATDLNKAMTIAKGANGIYKNATVIQMNRDLPANEPLVTEWRLSGAPVPLILVLSSKGLPTGGYALADATSANIAALVPSPKLEQVYAAIENKKPAIVVFTKKTLTDKTEVLSIGKDAVAKLKNNAVLVEVDMDDNRETGFMNQLRIDKLSKASITIVINAQGQVAGTSTTTPDAAKLAAAAVAVVKGGCGPGCGPAGCAK